MSTSTTDMNEADARALTDQLRRVLANVAGQPREAVLQVVAERYAAHLLDVANTRRRIAEARAVHDAWWAALDLDADERMRCRWAAAAYVREVLP